MERESGGDVAAALRDLVARYAIAIDTRDGDALLHLFHPDGAVAAPTGVLEGPRIGLIPRLLAEKYTKTYHFVGQSAFEVGEDTATGQTYGIAHHLTVDGELARDYVMHIRYLDSFRPDSEGQWKLASRKVEVDWTETREADAGSW